MKKILGLDLGNTIVGNHELGDRYYVEADCFDIISKLGQYFDDVYIISKVNSEQQERSLKWLEASDFFNKTGLKARNLYYCFERRDKAIFCKALGITHFVDDRFDVLRALDEDIVKVWFNPRKQELEFHRDSLKNTRIARSWQEAYKFLT